MTPGDVYRHFDPTLVATFTDGGDRTFEVPGVLLKVDRRVMRTEGVIVDALLGNGPALDGYAERLQELEVDRRAAAVAGEQAVAARHQLVNQAITDGDDARAAIAGRFHCCPCEHDEVRDADSSGSTPTPPSPAPSPSPAPPT